MTEATSDHCFPPSFTSCTSNSVPPHQFTVPGDVVENGDISEILSQANHNSSSVDSTCAMYAATIPAEFAGSLPEGTVFQIMPDATILAVTSATSKTAGVNCETIVFQDSSIDTAISNGAVETNVITSMPNYAIQIANQSSPVQSSEHAEGNISDIDLSFLNDPDDPASNSEIQGIQNTEVAQVELHSGVTDCVLQEHTSQDGQSFDVDTQFSDASPAASADGTAATDVDTALGSEKSDTVVVDVSKPIQLSQNSLIVVNGQKCVLQQDPQTGQVVAYPVKEPEKPRKKRGRPRKVHSDEPVVNDGVGVAAAAEVTEPAVVHISENASEEETAAEKGLLEVVTDDGSLVRRSSRKRKKAQILKDYETGNLNQELGSDMEDARALEKDDDGLGKKKGRGKGPGRPRKYPFQQNGLLSNGKRPRGRPRRYGGEDEPSQAFLIQTADGQTLMMKVPLSSIPTGMSLQDVAQDIANKLNLSLSQNDTLAKSAATVPVMNENNTSTESQGSVSEFLNSQSEMLSLQMRLEANQQNPSDSLPSDKSNAEELKLSDVEQIIETNIGSFTDVPGDEAMQHCGLDLVHDVETGHELPNFPPVSENISVSSNQCSVKGSDTVIISSDGMSQEAPYDHIEEITEEASGNIMLSENEKFADSLMNKHDSLSSSILSAQCLYANTKDAHGGPVDIIEQHVVSPKETGESSEKADQVSGGSERSFAFPSELEKSANIVFLETAHGNILGNSFLSASEEDNNDALKQATNDSEEEPKLNSLNSNQSGSIFDHEYGTLPPVKDLYNQESVAETLTLYEGCCSDSSAPESYLVSNNTDCLTEQNSEETVTEVSNIEQTLLSKDVDEEKNNSSDSALSKSAELQCSESKQVDSGKKRRGRPRKYPPVMVSTNVFNSPKIVPPALDVTSLQDVASLLSTADSSFIDNGVSSVSKPSTTVIPVPEKVLPLLLPKSEKSGSVTSAVTTMQKFQCRKCDFLASYFTDYQQHLSIHADQTKQCKCCQYLCFTGEELIEHYKVLHPRCICPKCNYMAEQPYAVKRHMLRHTDSGCSCSICGKIYKDHYILKMHVKIVHFPADVMYKCQICDKEFNRKAHLKRHLRTHDPDKPYKCSHCHYRGCEKSDITKHMLIHQEPKHLCEICGKTFRHIKNKELHIKRHKGQRDYKCGVCDFLGYTFTDIRKHIERRHKDQAIILCNRCGQACKSDEQLKEHQSSSQCEALFLEQSLAISENNLFQSANEDDANQLADEVVIREDHHSVDSSNQEQTVPEIPAYTIEALSNLPNSQIVLSNIEGLLTAPNGEIVISGLDGTEILPTANLAVISSEPVKGKESISDAEKLNQGILKMAFLTTSNIQGTPLPVISNASDCINSQAVSSYSAVPEPKVEILFESIAALNGTQNTDVRCNISS